MKKTLLAVLVVALVVSCFAMVFTANAAMTDVVVSNTPSGRGYFKLDDPIVDLNFESDALGGLTAPGDISGWYMAASQAEIVSDYDGNALKLTHQCEAWATDILSVQTWFAAYRDAGRYSVSFSVKPENATMITCCIRYAWGNTDLLADFRYNVQYSDGVATSVTKDIGGWTGANQGYFNEKIEVVDGVIKAYFEYDVADDVAWGANCPNVTFQGANGADASSYTFDNIKIEKLNNQYYNINWDVDYGALSTVWGEQPVWVNSGDIVANYFGTGVTALKINAVNTNNTGVGGLENREGYFGKVSKDPVMTYFQFDIDLEGLTYCNIWSSASYTAVISDGTAWRTEGNILSFKVTPLDQGWRLSYFIDMSANGAANMDFGISTTGSGAVYIANFLVAQIDDVRAPWVSSETVTYNKVTPHDVTVNLDTKGREITSLTCGGDAVDVANYSYVGETLTLNAAAFDGKTGDLSFTATTAGGSANFEVKQEQTKIPTTASLASNDAINKYYDGTTDVKEEIVVNLSDIEEGHDVSVEYTAAYNSANTGTGRKITLTLTLTGTHAYLYELTNETLEITDCEIYALIYLPITYNGNPIVKYEDGTTSVVGKINLTLEGVEEGDVVSITFDSEYESALVGNRQILITNITLTGKDAYKYALVTTSFPIDGEIIARTETTVSYDGVIEKRFDGTTFLSTKGLELALSNIADGDEVSVTFRAHFSNVDVGESTVKIVDIELTGKDAHKYKLTSDHLDVNGYILGMKDISLSDDKGYYTMDGQTLQSFDFENVAIGNVSSNTINGLYVAPANAEVGSGITQTASIVDDDGNKVLKIEENCFAYSTQLFSTNATGSYREQGIYAVSFKVKPLNSSIIGVLIRNGYAANDAMNILADYRYAVTNDGTGKAISIAKDIQGFLGSNQKYSNGSIEVDDEGWIDCYFEFELPDGIEFGDEFCPVIIFTGASATNMAVSTYYFDDIKYICKSNSNKYMTVDHNYDFEGVHGKPAIDTPFHSILEGVDFVYDSDWTSEFVDNNTVIRLDIPANNGNQVGALKNGVADGTLKLLKGTGIHYVQFDFDTSCSTFNLFVLGYFDIQCTANGVGDYTFKVEVYNPSLSNFTTQVVENGMTRVSFLLDMTGIPYDEFFFSLKATTSSAGGEIYFDNLFVSHEDYTPIAANAKYDFIDTQDVVFKADLKGSRLLGLELDGVAVAADMYVYNAETDTITLDKSLFETTNPNAVARVLTIKTSAGNIDVYANIVDNRPEVTLTLDYTGDAIAKDYDGTTDVDQDVIDAIVAQIVMDGVADGDDVSLTYDVAYSTKNAGAVSIVISNIALSGNDAVKYTLANTTLSVSATINKIQLTVSGTTAANKEYDGTTSATATAGTLSGVINGDTVTLSVTSAIFNSKNVTEANKVTVTYALSGEDAANYIVPASHDISNVSITKKTVTVTAAAKTMTVGGSDPELTYTVTGLITGDALTGALTRAEGTEVGEYNILQGTLSAGDNYQINFVSAKLTIVEASTGEPDPTEPTEPTESDGLTPGAIAGIVVGSVAVVGGGAGLAVWFILRKKRLAK